MKKIKQGAHGTCVGVNKAEVVSVPGGALIDGGPCNQRERGTTMTQGRGAGAAAGGRARAPRRPGAGGGRTATRAAAPRAARTPRRPGGRPATR